VTGLERRRPSWGQRTAAVAGVCVLLLGALFLTLLALLGGAADGCMWNCDEADTWQYDDDAWQWKLQRVLALVGLGLVGAALPLAAGGRFRATRVVLAIAVAVFLGWWILLHT
jgi:hypothetical protein